MQKLTEENVASIEDDLSELNDLSLKSYFKASISPDDVSALAPLKRATPLVQAFSGLFHGGLNGVLMRLLVLRELALDVDCAAISRADINLKLAYLEPDALETVLARLRNTNLMVWDASSSVYRITPLARNVLSAIETLLQSEVQNDESDVSYMLSQVAGQQAVGGVSVEQLHHLLGRLIELTEEFSDAIASGSEFQLRNAQVKWHTACDWVEKGSTVIHAITNDERADSATHRAAQAIGRAQSALLNMQGMFSRALNQIERQRVHLGQSGLSTTDIKTWLLQHPDITSLADDALSHPVTPLFITPSEMIDVAESELLTRKNPLQSQVLPIGENAPSLTPNESDALMELDNWILALDDLCAHFKQTSLDTSKEPKLLSDMLLPNTFALASYRASLLPLIGDENESALQGATGTLARLPLSFITKDKMKKCDDPHIAAMSIAHLAHVEHINTDTENHENAKKKKVESRQKESVSPDFPTSSDNESPST